MNASEKSQIGVLDERTKAIGGDIDEIKQGLAEVTRAIKGQNGTPGMLGQFAVLNSRLEQLTAGFSSIQEMDDRLREVEGGVKEVKMLQDAYPSLTWLLKNKTTPTVTSVLLFASLMVISLSPITDPGFAELIQEKLGFSTDILWAMRGFYTVGVIALIVVGLNSLWKFKGTKI